MEHTFITIHNLTPEANILFASESITDILGYLPDEVERKSCFDYFHPDEVPFARSVHSRGVLLDKAAVLHYARILSRDGQWVSCECCFTIVHDVLVASTSIYKRDVRSERRAMEAPQIRRIFSCSPRDPRYHMLEHLSPKFKMPPMEREPRAALILNRFTRNLTVMFATNAVTSILGLHPDQIKDLSFYRCIQENCLPEALRCLESAKTNNSIAYLRFWFRDPRGEDELLDPDQDDHDGEQLSCSTSDSDGGGAQLADEMDLDWGEESGPDIKVEPGDSLRQEFVERVSPGRHRHRKHAPASDDRSTTVVSNDDDNSTPMSVDEDGLALEDEEPRLHRRHPLPSIELEAVVSCTSDGLVVILRKARPPIPAPHPPLVSWEFRNGLFAAPWAQQPIRPYVSPELLYTFRPPLLPQYMPLRDNVKAAGGPPLEQLMKSIRDVAVFAWALAGINGNLVAHSHGLPRGESQPHDGLPVWESNTRNRSYIPADNHMSSGWTDVRGNGASPTGISSSTAYRQDVWDYARQTSNDLGNYTYSQPQTWSRSGPSHTAGYRPVPESQMNHLPPIQQQRFPQYYQPSQTQLPPQHLVPSETRYSGPSQEATQSASTPSSIYVSTPAESGSSSDQQHGYPWQ